LATLGSCAAQNITATVQIPAAAGRHITDTFSVLAQSQVQPAVGDVISQHTKTPAPVLLVDDDRWYSFADAYKTALRSNGIDFDYWYVPKSWSGPSPPSPPTSTLQIYPLVVWYNAYDWFQPLTVEEENRLMSYLDGGGRLFFSSQDFLYQHLRNHGSYAPFAQDYLGVLAHTEDLSSTLAVGNNYSQAGAYLGPYALTFPPGYHNWTDTLTPTTAVEVYSLGQHDHPNGLTNAGTGPGGRRWHTNFLAFGPELMAADEQATFMRRSVGWLSWLGESTIEAEVGQLAGGAIVTYSAVISNNSWADIGAAAFTATFPAGLTPLNGSAGLGFDGSRFTWSGPLAAGARQAFTYTAQINQAVSPGVVITQSSWLAYDEHNLRFDRVTGLSATPDLRGSRMVVTPTQDIQQSDTLTYSIVLTNNGLADGGRITTTNTLPKALRLMSIDPAAGTVDQSGNSITWTTALTKGAAITLTYYAVVSETGFSVKNVAHVDDGFNPTVNLSAEAMFEVMPIYFPVIYKGN
jgi:uncharacterized repeat protein (TIGR01451 family)